jgi:hypothetical protein
MHIKEITLDGFKSYAQRVIVPGFDSQFNAITGLNGSFVLGITNLQQVSAFHASYFDKCSSTTIVISGAGQQFARAGL